MKILFITNTPSPYRVDFFEKLGEKSDLTVLFETKYAKDRDIIWRDGKMRNFKYYFLKGIRIGQAEAFCPNVLKWISDRRYDIVVIGFYSSPTEMLAIEYMKLHKIPFFISMDGAIYNEKEGKFKFKFKRHFLKSACAWLSSGNVTTEYLLKYGAIKSKIFLYHFSSILKKDIIKEPIKKEEKIYLKSKLGIKEKKVVISVGQFIKRKGYDILLKSWENMDRNVGLYIIGGKITEEYENLIKELNLKNVHFIEFLKKDVLLEYYKASDLFVLPTREDIWGLVINEAMACGLPIFTTNKCVAGIEMIRNNGRIYNVENKWGNEVEKIIFNTKELGKMSISSINIANQYTIEQMVDDHLVAFYNWRKKI